MKRAIVRPTLIILPPSKRNSARALVFARELGRKLFLKKLRAQAHFLLTICAEIA